MKGKGLRRLIDYIVLSIQPNLTLFPLNGSTQNLIGIRRKTKGTIDYTITLAKNEQFLYQIKQSQCFRAQL
jgi:hypothetical protein